MPGFQAPQGSAFQGRINSGFQAWGGGFGSCRSVFAVGISGSHAYSGPGPNDLSGAIANGKRAVESGDLVWVFSVTSNVRDIEVLSENETYWVSTNALRRVDVNGDVVWTGEDNSFFYWEYSATAVDDVNDIVMAVGGFSETDPTDLNALIATHRRSDGERIVYVSVINLIGSVLAVDFESSWFLCGETGQTQGSGDKYNVLSLDSVGPGGPISYIPNGRWVFQSHPGDEVFPRGAIRSVSTVGSTVFICGDANDDSSGVGVWALDDSSTSTDGAGYENPAVLGDFVPDGYSLGESFSLKDLATNDGVTVFVCGESDGNANLWRLNWNGTSFSVQDSALLAGGATAESVAFDGTVLVLGLSCASSKGQPVFIRVDPNDLSSVLWQK